MSISNEDVLSYYRDRLKKHQRSLEQELRRVRFVQHARVVAGLCVPAVLWLGLAIHIVSAWFALVPAAMHLALHWFHERLFGALTRATRAMKYYERGMARVEGRWPGTGIVDTLFAEPDHIYANDLDIFGEGSLFELLCTARTTAGQETLARWLTRPASRGEILRRQEAVEELRNHIDLREGLWTSSSDGAATDMASIGEWTSTSPTFAMATARRVAPLLVAFTICALGYSYVIKDARLFALPAAVQIGFAFFYRRHVSNIIGTVREPAAEIGRLYAPLSRLEHEQFHSPKLREMRRALDADGGSAASEARWLTGLTVMLDYRHNPNTGLILPIFMWSTQIGFAIEAWRCRHRSRIRTWIEVVGEFEALCALATFAYEHPTYLFPQIDEEPPHIEADELRHPPIPASQCVPNSVRLGGSLQLMIVSGSNMSGKSTFLRTLGINLVLGQAGAPVAARQFQCSVMMLGATLRIQDSLRTGASRFYTEVRRLNDILNHAQRGYPVLFLLDEILHGTNSHDRVVGAEAVLRALLDAGAIGVVTTHDLAIAEIALRLGCRATNMHFQDRMEDGTLVFDYVLHAGVVTRSNAIELMRAAGLRI